jgi:hypothetical protein
MDEWGEKGTLKQTVKGNTHKDGLHTTERISGKNFNTIDPNPSVVRYPLVGTSFGRM